MQSTQNKPKSNTSTSPQSQFSVEQLIKLAEQAYDEFSPGIAAKYYEQAIQKQPNDALLYHKLALMYVEYGEPLQAHKAFLKSIELSPEDNESNYLYIGQQCEGFAAKSAFERGIDLMEKKINTLRHSNDEEEKLGISKEKEIKGLQQEISNAYVSIAELFMTDLCEEQEAQIECEKYLNLALKYDINNIEAYSTFGQFRLCQENDNEATKYFALSLQKLFGGQQKEEEDEEEKMENKLDIFNEDSLSIDSLLKIVKLGIELEQYEPCCRVLKGLITANDGIGELWALGSLCYYKLNQSQDAAIWYYNAKDIFETDSSNVLNVELQQTLEVIESIMNVEELPDISKLNLDGDTMRNKDEGKLMDDEAVDAFLENDDDDDYDLDVDKRRMNGVAMQNDDEDEDIDINNDGDMIDID